MSNPVLNPTTPTTHFRSMRPIVTTHLVDPGVPFQPGTRIGRAPTDLTFTAFAGDSLTGLHPFRNLSDALAAAKTITSGPPHPGVAVMDFGTKTTPFIELFPLTSMMSDNLSKNVSIDGDVGFEQATKFSPGALFDLDDDLVALVDGAATFVPSVAPNDEIVLVKQ